MSDSKINNDAMKASNLLWRWEMHVKGMEAFHNSFMAASFHSEMLTQVRHDTYRTYTDRLYDRSSSRLPVDDPSPASAQMLMFAMPNRFSPGASANDLPPATRKAMIDWLKEHRSLLSEMQQFFKSDETHHPYQRCIHNALDASWRLVTFLTNEFAAE
jgi:hypothetical protein